MGDIFYCVCVSQTPGIKAVLSIQMGQYVYPVDRSFRLVVLLINKPYSECALK